MTTRAGVPTSGIRAAAFAPADGGLTGAQVTARRAADGRNELPPVAAAGPLGIVGRQLTDPVILVLAAAAVLTAVTSEPVNTAVIVVVIALNTALGTWQELRSSRAIAALSDLTAARATVRRDGVTVTVDAREVVRGDHVLLAAGDVVAADGRLLESTGLELDESILTGESMPVARGVGEAVSGSTVVTLGRGTIVVDAVGGSSRLGGIARRGVLARSLASVEALGSVSVIASDKTGTLTTGELTVDDVRPAATVDRTDLLIAAALCNDADPGSGSSPHDDPLEVALVRAALLGGVDVGRARAENPRTGEQAFDARLARMSTDHRGPDGGFTICKGSFEAVGALVGGEPSVAAAAPVAERIAAAGRRVIAVARRPDGGAWQLLGLVGFTDPPRADAARTIAAFRAAGVTPIMITGDHASTAGAVAAAVGIAAADVHARVQPEGKLAIVEGLRHGGDVVAMTGDGVNDAPALRAADIGVAMGLRGTEVAKQAAGIVLRTDDLSAMIPAIVEGRRAYDNVRRFLVYALAGDTAEVLVMLVGPFVGFAIPLQAAQILWINLLTHGLPGVAMGDDPAAAPTATAPPRPRAQQILDRPLLRRIGALGATAAATSTGTALLAREVDVPWQSALFLTLLMAQLAVALGLQPRHPGVPANRWLLGAVALNVVLGVAAVTWPVLGDLLQLDPMRAPELLLVLPAALVSGALARALRVEPRRRPAAGRDEGPPGSGRRPAAVAAAHGEGGRIDPLRDPRGGRADR